MSRGLLDVTIDLETSVDNHEIGKHKASPFYPDNQVVMTGVKTEKTALNNAVGVRYKGEDQWVMNAHRPPIRLIGQNLKFDMHYIRRDSEDDAWLRWQRESLEAWDTQLAEYILTGQDTKYASLDELSAKYGGTQKVDIIKEMWNAGVRTEDIDPDVLKDYLEHDVLNTQKIYMKQKQEAERRGIMPLIATQMGALCATQEMEYNGMYVDQEHLQSLHREYYDKMYEIDIQLRTKVLGMSANPIPPEHVEDVVSTLNMGSTQQLSKIIFGGRIEYKTKEKCGVYKTGAKKGQDKYKAVKHGLEFEHAGAAISQYADPMKREGIFKVDDNVLQSIASQSGVPAHIQDFVNSISEYRKLSKEVTTYYGALMGLIFPDGMVHTNLNHCATHTGRLSSNNPNAQNYPSSGDSKVKTVFTSRWGDDGVIIEADYKQLEVIALAFLSRDPILMDDILKGRDMHFETGKTVFGWSDPSDMDKDSRRIVKTVNFGLIYGGSAKTLAKQAGCTESVAQACVDAFYGRYSNIPDWQDSVYKAVTESRESSSKMTAKGYPSGKGTYRSLTGRTYTFYEYDVPWDEGKTNFSPTQTKNYPGQGLATGDIMPMIMGKLLKRLKMSSLHDTCLMVNQVHDAILFDCKKDSLDDALFVIQEEMEKAPQYFQETFGIEFDLPLKVDIGYGKNWKEAA